MLPGRFSARAFWGLASWALPLAVVFLLTPKLLHALGPERFGVLMLIFVTPLVAAQLDFGIASTSVRKLAERLSDGQVDARQTLATFGAALTLIGIAVGAAVWLAAAPISFGLGFDSVLGVPQGIELIRACAIWIVFSMAALLPGLVARAAQALAWITAVQTLSAVLLWLGALALARAGRPLTEVVALGVGLSILSAALTAFAMRRRVDWSGPIAINLQPLTSERNFSAGMFGSQLASMLVYQGDRILISAIGSPAIVGAYALCVNVANKTLAAVVALTTFVFPHATALHVKGSHAEIEALVHALNRAVTIVVIPLLLPGWVLADPFLSLWLGQFNSAELTTAFRILWVAFAIPAFAVPIANVLISSGRATFAARFSWLTVVVVFASITLLVPDHGLLGAAVAVLLGMSTSLLFRFSARQVMQIGAGSGSRRFYFGVGLGVVSQAAFLAASGKVDHWHELLAIGLGAWSIFYLVRAIFRAMSPEEERLLKQLASFRPSAPRL